MFWKLLFGWIPRDDGDDPPPDPDPDPNPDPDPDPDISDTLKLFDEPDNFLKLVPTDYQKKGYMKGVGSMDAVMKKLDGAMIKLGEKSDFAFPKEDATDEQLTDFRTKHGVPTTAADYEINRPDDYKETETSKAYEIGLRDLFHAQHLSADQVKAVTEGQDKLVNEVQASIHKEFMAMADKHFGGKKDAMLASSNKILEENAPDAFKETIANMDNETAIAVAAVFHKFASQYMNPDKLPDSGDGGGGGMSIEDLNAKLNEYIGHEAYRDPTHRENKSIHLKAKKVSEQIAQFQAHQSRVKAA